jgi:hypothetical protein
MLMSLGTTMRMLLRARLGLIAIILSSLAACGGGGGSGSSGDTTPPVGNPPPSTPPPTPPPTATAEDLANADNAQLRIVYLVGKGEIEFVWKDTFSSETGFQIEARTPGGTWQVVTSMPAANGSELHVQRALDGSKNYRVSAVMAGYTVPLETTLGQAEIPIDLTSPAILLSVNQSPTVRGIAQLTLDNAASIEQVSYSAGTDTIGTTSSGPRFSFDWNTTALPDGPYTLYALARHSSGAYLLASWDVVVDNPHLAASLQVERASGSLTNFDMHARASSDAGIQSVAFFLDDNPVQTLPGGAAEGEYSYTLVTSGLTSGNHTFRIVATDRAGETVEAIRVLAIDNAPVVTLDSPVTGLIVTSTLHVAGSFADDQPGATLTVSLGNAAVLQTSTAGAFSVDHSLTGLTPGEYTLTVRAVDSQQHETIVNRNFNVVSSGPTAELIATDVSLIHATEQGAVLYEKTDGTVILRRADGTEVTLQIPTGMTQAAAYYLSSGHVMVTGSVPPPAPTGTYHIYLFDAAGHVTNYSEQFGSNTNLGGILRYPWLIWNTGSRGHFEIHNLVTQSRTIVTRPAGTAQIEGVSGAFIATPGAEQLIFSATETVSGSTGPFGLFRYELASGVTYPVIGSATTNHRYVATDDARIAWRRSENFTMGRNLMVAPVANTSANETLSTAMSAFHLRDGLLGWIEPNGDGTSVLKVNDGTSTTVITSSATSAPYVSDGRITFTENGRTYVWKSDTGPVLLLDTRPLYTPQHDDGVAFFLNGTPSTTLYRILLP